MSRLVIVCQGLYYIVTGVWPLFSMSTFEAVTGPKTDDWLVHTVGVLLAAIGLALLAGARRPVPAAETVVLACGATLALAGIEVFYVMRGTIGPIYLADTAVEGIILAALLLSLRRQRA